MVQTEDSRIRLMQAWIPDLKTGKYTVEAEQVLEAPVKKTAGSEKLEFYVNCPKFSLAQNEVYGLYPDMGSRGNYGSTMPHVVFESENLPWERTVEGQDEYYPWMALVCFSKEELPQIQQCAVGDLGKLRKQGVYTPDFTYEKTTGESSEQVCEYMDVDKKSYKELFPRQDEVPLLSHVRMIDLHEKEDSLISLDGTFSSLVCNRFPVSSEGNGTENVLCAVSLEGYGTRLPGGKDFESALKEYDAFRFVILYRWSIHSVAQEYPGFRRILEQMEASAFSAPGGEDTMKVGEILKRGYLPLGHITRTGEQTVSFYRGPLSPYSVEDTETKECTSADGEIRYDPAMGMMDMSYSAAWQLGRMLALKNQTIAQSICRWRKETARDMFLNASRQRLAEKLGMENRKTMEDGSVELDFLRMYGKKLAKELVQSQRIAPLGDPTGLRGARERMPGLYAPDRVRGELRSLGVNCPANDQEE